MKRIVAGLWILLAVICPSVIVSAAEAEITKPQNGITVREGYSLPVAASVSGAAEAMLYVNGEPAEKMQITAAEASCELKDMSIGEYSLSVKTTDYNGVQSYSDEISVSVKPYGYRRYAWESFDCLNLSANGMDSSVSFELDDKLMFNNYYYDTLETSDGRLHLKRTPVGAESFASKYATISYVGGSSESRFGRLGRAGYYSYELEITPMQTNILFYPLQISYNTSFSTSISSILQFNARGRIMLFGKDIGAYTAGKRYKIRIEFDTENEFCDVYINDDRIAAHRKISPETDYKNGGGAVGKNDGIYSLRTSFAAVKNSPAEFYVDNIRLEQYIRPVSEEVITVAPGTEIDTINKAFEKVGTIGTTIRVMPGVYNENVAVNISGGDFDKFKIVGEEGAVLRGTLTVNGNNVSVRGLTVDGEARQLFTDEELKKITAKTYTAAEKNEFSSREGKYRNSGVIIGGSSCELIGCTVKDLMGTAITVNGSNGYIADNYIANVSGGIFVYGRNTLVENNEINRINCFYGQKGAGDVFRVMGCDAVIRGNYAHGTLENDVWQAMSNTYAHADFVQSYDDTKNESGNALIENNIALGFYHQCFMLENDKYGASTGKYYIHDWTVRNNIFSGNESWGICGGKVGGGIPNMNVYNNIFDCSLAYYGVAFSDKVSVENVYNNVIFGKNCLFVQADATIIARNNALVNYSNPINNKGGTIDEMGTLYFENAADVGFVNYTPGYHASKDEFDLRLRADSPLIDAGFDVDFDADMNANVRKSGAAVDIGPYEYGAESKSDVQIVFPAEGYSILEGTTLDIKSSAPDTEFYADGVRVNSRWKPEHAGIYTLKAVCGGSVDEVSVTVYPKNRTDTAVGGIDIDGRIKVSVFENYSDIDVYAAAYEEELLNVYHEKLPPDGEKGIYTIDAPEDIRGTVKIFVWTDGQKPLGEAVTVYR